MPDANRNQIIVGFGVATAMLFASVLFVRSCLGSGLGGRCGPTTACQFGLSCIHAQCVPKCRDDDDCPKGMRCSILQAPETELGDGTGPMLICLPKEAVEREVERSVSASDSRLTALNRKRTATYDAVQKLLVAQKWTLTDEAFDNAWDRLPPAVRRERSVDDLAKLIMTTAGNPIR